MIEQKDWLEALKRISLTEDGWLLYCGLHKVAISMVDGADPAISALRRLDGRRSLAREMMAVMAEGIDERGKRAGTDKLSDAPVAFAQPKPVAIRTAGRGAGRRIDANTRVPGWDRDSPDDGSAA